MIKHTTTYICEVKDCDIEMEVPVYTIIYEQGDGGIDDRHFCCVGHMIYWQSRYWKTVFRDVASELPAIED